MKNLLLASALASTLLGLGQARADTLANFNAYYNDTVKKAVQAGQIPQRTCFPDYCANYVQIAQTGGGWVAAFNIVRADGINVREFCNTLGADIVNRRCYFSDGQVIDQHWDGRRWQIVETVQTYFTE